MEDSRMEAGKRFFISAVQLVFVRYFYLTLIVIGIAAVIIPLLVAPGKSEHPAFKAIGSIGTALLVAGAVTTFMRFFASLDLVGERIRNWLGDERYLNDLTDRLTASVYEPDRSRNLGNLEKVWRQISHAMTAHSFPEITNDVYDHTLKKLQEISADYYFSSLERRTHIDPVDGEGDFVTIRHHWKMTVVPNKNRPAARFATRLQLKEGGSDKDPVLEFFAVDGKQRTVSPQPENDGLYYTIEADLHGADEVLIEYSYSFRQSLAVDPFLLWTTTRYVRRASFTVNHPDNITVAYKDTTFQSLLKKKDYGAGNGELVHESRNNELIFPGSAFMFVVRPLPRKDP